MIEKSKIKNQKSKTENLKNKKIVVLGYGVENQALVEWLIRHGANQITICDQSTKFKCQILNEIQSSNVKKGVIVRTKQSGVENSKAKLLHRTSFESKNIKFQLGKDYLKNLDKYDIVFRTPGLPYNTSEIQQAIKKGVEVSSQMKLFFDLCPARIIGVTGTKGKGTTAVLISQILKRNFQFPISNFQKKSEILNLKSKIYLGGNIGNPPIDFLDQIKKNDWVMLELSSFQLQDLRKSPHIAVILNISSDHLDHHKDVREYVDAKTNIVRYQKRTDFSVINLDYLTSFEFAAISPGENDYYFSTTKSVDLGAFVKNGKIVLRTENEDFEICNISDIKLVGKHNLENVCAAITASYLAGAQIKSIEKAVKSYRGLEHRLELIRIYKGVKYYDDSASTNPYTTIAAIRSFSKPIILIAGGSDKGADYLELGKVIAGSKNINKVILIGKTAGKIKKTIKQYSNITIEQFGNKFSKAIESAMKTAKSGDIVILSPASASFDMFRNYEERGKKFKEIVNNIR